MFLNANLLSYLYRKETNNKASSTTQPIYGNLQSCYQKLICKIRQNFRESTLGNNLIVRDDTKKINFTQMERYGTHCQAKHKNQLDFIYNALFASQNVAKMMMKENRLPIFMTSFKEIMASTYIAKLFSTNIGAYRTEN